METQGIKRIGEPHNFKEGQDFSAADCTSVDMAALLFYRNPHKVLSALGLQTCAEVL